jgi:hypothetical protein
MDNMNYMIIGLFIIIIYIFYQRNKQENLTVDDRKRFVGETIRSYLKPDTDYKDYLEFLTQIKSDSYKLLDQQIFYEMKFLLKNNDLTVDKIMNYMSDVS